MKTTALIVVCLVLIVAGFYGCTHQVTYTTVYPRKAQTVQKAYVSPKGEALITTSDGYMVIEMLPQFEQLPFGPSGLAGASKSALPHWDRMIPGSPSTDLLHDFAEVPLFRLTLQTLASHPDSETLRKMPAVIVFENENYTHGQAFAWLSFRFYSTEPKYQKFDAMIFSIELPSKLERHVSPKPSKFMSMGG